MLVLVLECAPPKLYGFCSSWALQVATGVFVANLPAKTRDEIWEQVVQWSNPETRAVMIVSSSANEQRIEYRTIGEPRRCIVEREGLLVSAWIPRDDTDPNAPKHSP